MRLVGEGADADAAVKGPENPDDEGLGGCLGEGVGGEDEEGGDGGGREAGGEEVDDEDAGGDEEGLTRGVEGEALGDGDVSGDLGDAAGATVGSAAVVVLVEDLGFEGRGGGGEEEESAGGRGVEEEEGGDELGEGEAGGEDHEAATSAAAAAVVGRRVLEKVRDYVVVEFHHC